MSTSTQLNLVDALKYGAIGISFVCLAFAFWNNQSLQSRAEKLPLEVLNRLLSQAKWTMAFSFMCLLAAIMVETLDHMRAPVTLRIGLTPSIDAHRLHYLKAIGTPIRLQIGAEAPIPLTDSDQIQVSPNTQILVDVDGIWETVRDLDGDLYGRQQTSQEVGGTLEPRR